MSTSGIEQQSLKTIEEASNSAIRSINEVLQKYQIQDQEMLYGIVAGIAAHVVSHSGKLPVDESIKNIQQLLRQVVRIIHYRALSPETKPLPNAWENKADLPSMATLENSPTQIEGNNARTLSIDSAYVAGRDAIVKKLGKNASREDVLDVIQLMAHSALTENKTLGLPLANHNITVFCETLRAMVERTQGGNSSSYGGRLM